MENLNYLKELNYINLEDGNKLYLKNIYSEIDKKEKLNINESLDINLDYYKINIKRFNKLIYTINIYNSYLQKNVLEELDILVNPFEILYQDKYVTITCLIKFKELSKMPNYEKLAFYCDSHSVEFDFSFGELIKHYEKYNNDCIFVLNKRYQINYTKEKNEFDAIFNNYKKKSIFESPKSFDKNYSNYFDFYSYQEEGDEFEFYDDNDNNRFMWINTFLSDINILGFLNIYYGSPGMGKSITLIKAFKYEYDHQIFGTLYINCKYFHKSYVINFEQMKKILEDEVVYLFQNEYNEYKKCIASIEKMNQNMYKNFWDIIKFLIKTYCKNKTKKYIFIFDQYKKEFDKNDELYNLNEFLKSKKDNGKQYGLIACCSLDNKSIRELKVQNLFESKTLNYMEDNIRVKEIKELFDISNLTIDHNGIYDQTLEKIGKNIKNFIILKVYCDYKKYLDLKKYVKDLKNKICKNLKNFFGLNNGSHEKKEEQESLIRYLTPLLSFTVDTDYDNRYIKTIKNYIPFKYFDIESTNKRCSKIIFKFSLVGDAMTEIYENVIYHNKSIYSIFSYLELDAGALGGLFEKCVIHFMEPDKYQTHKCLFDYFNLKGIEIVDKFVPRNNENYWLTSVKIKSLSDGDYFFKQEQFNGKAFDCAIIRIFKKEAYVFFFQISINKEKIYDIINLRYFINAFIDYFRYLYNFRINANNVYFTYIFHDKNKNELYEKCKANNLNCIFFNFSTKMFFDSDDIELRIIKEPNEIFINPFLPYKNADIIINYILNKNSKIIGINNKISLKLVQKESIEKFWKTLFPEFHNKKLNLIYSHYVNEIDGNYLNKTNMYFLELRPNEINSWIKIIDLPNKNIKEKITMKELEEKQKLIKEINDTKKEFSKNKNSTGNKKLFLMIFKKNNLKFRIILDNGMIKCLKYIQIIEDDGMKFYDVYFIIEES